MRRAPKKLWLEQWPDRACREDSMFYVQTGYGDDMRGNTSRVTVYVREAELLRAKRDIAAANARITELEAQLAARPEPIDITVSEFRALSPGFPISTGKDGVLP